LANLTVTISNSVNCLGGAPSTKWGDFSWGFGKWGQGTNAMLIYARSVFSDSLSLTDLSAVTPRVVSTDSLASTFDNLSETLQDSQGYYYVFIDHVTNAENRPNGSYTCAVADPEAWISQAAGITTWS
jgi:hypothetical protein